MLAVTQLIGFGAKRATPPPVLAFLQLTDDPANLTNYSFASVNFGPEDPTRRIICAVHFGDAVSSRTISSATIGGVAATIHTQAGLTGGVCAIISALVPTGTSGTVAINLTGAASRCAIATYSAMYETSATPFNVATPDTSVTAGLLSTTIDVPINGWVISADSRTSATGAGFTHTGVTEQYDSPWAEALGTYRSGGFASGLAAQTGRTISSQSTDTAAQNGALCAISWG